MNSPSKHNSTAEPQWLDKIPVDAAISPTLMRWLNDQGSLTRLLIQTCEPEGFAVDVLEQSWQMPLPSETALLQIQPQEQAFVRQVRLLCAKQYRVFARTVIPTGSFEGETRHLGELQNKPLGAVLFSDPRTRRVTMQFACLQKNHHLHNLAMQHETDADENVSLWGRRTLFLYADHPLIVNEIFMPVMETVKL